MYLEERRWVCQIAVSEDGYISFIQNEFLRLVCQRFPPRISLAQGACFSEISHMLSGPSQEHVGYTCYEVSLGPGWILPSKNQLQLKQLKDHVKKKEFCPALSDICEWWKTIHMAKQTICTPPQVVHLEDESNIQPDHLVCNRIFISSFQECHYYWGRSGMGSKTGSVIDYQCWEVNKLEGRKPAWTPSFASPAFAQKEGL